MKAVNSADVDALMALYDVEAILLPTFSNKFLNTPEKIHDYFVRLASREELSIALHEKTLVCHAIQNESYLLNGIYNWRFSVDGELLNFEARFTYVIDLTREKPILHHHSSQVPRMI